MIIMGSRFSAETKPLTERVRKVQVVSKTLEKIEDLDFECLRLEDKIQFGQRKLSIPPPFSFLFSSLLRVYISHIYSTTTLTPKLSSLGNGFTKSCTCSTSLSSVSCSRMRGAAGRKSTASARLISESARLFVQSS